MVKYKSLRINMFRITTTRKISKFSRNKASQNYSETQFGAVLLIHIFVCLQINKDMYWNDE